MKSAGLGPRFFHALQERLYGSRFNGSILIPNPMPILSGDFFVPSPMLTPDF